jgi:hypothetical protein
MSNTPARSPAATATPAGDASSEQARRRRQLVLLAVLTVILGGLVVFVLVPALSGGAVAPPPPVPQATAPQPGASAQPGRRREVVDVHLERLEAKAADPVDGGRNPFRMGAAARTQGPGAGEAPSQPVVAPGPPAPAGPPPPPSVPPIPFRFVGIVTGPGARKMAVLSDGRIVVHGSEGQEIDGRYRIVKIGEESIQVEHLDGRGRQTIRLSGQ